MIKSQDVKSGLDITVEDGIVVLNSVSLKEKEEQKQEEQEQEKQPSEDIAATITPDVKIMPDVNSVTQDESSISVPNIEIPVPDSQIDANAVGSIPNVGAVTFNTNDNFSSESSQQFEIPNPNINIYNQNNVNFQETSTAFKTTESVTNARDEFLSECGKIFDEKLKVPVENLVKITNGAIELLNDVFINGIRKNSFDRYNEFIEAYKNVIEANALDEEKEPNESKYNDSYKAREDINFPRF